MDIIQIIDGFKGKALDLKNIELLKHAYSLQNQNIIQLKDNNDALKEANSLLKEKLDSLIKEKIDLLSKIETLQKSQERSAEKSIQLSSCAMDVLKVYIDKQPSQPTDEEVEGSLGSKYQPLQVQAAINELRKNELVFMGVKDSYRRTQRSLTPKGKQFIVDNFIKNV